MEKYSIKDLLAAYECYYRHRPLTAIQAVIYTVYTWAELEEYLSSKLDPDKF